ncbi:MAG TPA: DUF3574 domain-containing protein [Acetobacteraceae bacterium]|nr:DUF3574 domain-containing protein [Acetobacteraceae bacterium]
MAGAAPMQIVELYFGRDVPGRASVTAAEWADFSGHELTPRFPDGFTVLDGQGQWRNPRTGVIGREASWVVVAAVPMGTDLAARVDPVVGAYRARFHQESVGVVTEEACGRF